PCGIPDRGFRPSCRRCPHTAGGDMCLPGYNQRMPTPPKILARRSTRLSRPIRTEQLDLEFSNGARRTYERRLDTGHGAVIIVPMRDADTVLLIREFAAGMEHYELGLPKGRLDAGESAFDGANRELKEEAG